jgi:hypothetical protein
MVAAIAMTAECRRSTLGDGPAGPQMVAGRPSLVPPLETISRSLVDRRMFSRRSFLNVALA